MKKVAVRQEMERIKASDDFGYYKWVNTPTGNWEIYFRGTDMVICTAEYESVANSIRDLITNNSKQWNTLIDEHKSDTVAPTT
jgi:hypothetical protein